MVGNYNKNARLLKTNIFEGKLVGVVKLQITNDYKA